MRTRYKKYSDYGLSKEDVFDTFDYLNEKASDQDKDYIRVLLAEHIPEYACQYVALALLEHKGYNTLVNHYSLNMLQEDFYGYKRKGVYLVHRWKEGR